MRPHQLDLFGDVIITHQDVRAWLVAVPRIDPDSPRAEHYVRGWDVVGKIRAAKLCDRFEAVTAQREPPPGHWWLRFRWS
jgi:hypothetical protein